MIATILIVLAIIATVILWSMLKLSGDLSRQEELAEMIHRLESQGDQ